VDFYREWQEKEKAQKAEKEAAGKKQELYISGAAKWSLMTHSEREKLHKKAIEETDLISTLHENGEIQNKRIEERIFLELGKEKEAGLATGAPGKKS
jgi:PIN domain nuclease of toxin-antitoxin system